MPHFDMDLFDKIVEVLNESYESIMKELAPLLNCTKSPLYPPDKYQTIAEKSAYLQKKNYIVLQRIQEICARYDRKKLLFSTRMIPCAYVSKLRTDADLIGNEIADHLLFENGTILATKAILHFSYAQPKVRVDYDEFLNDSYRLIVLSSIRSLLNSANLRLRIYDDEDFAISTEMIKEEVARPIFLPAGDMTPKAENQYLLILLPTSLAPEDAMLKIKFKDENEFQELSYVNFIPYFVKADEYLANYSCLGNSSFEGDHKIPFDKFCEYFSCLTRFIISKLLFKDNEQKVGILNDADVYKLVSYVGITGNGLIEIKEKELIQHFKKNFSDRLCLKEYKNFIDSLIIDEHDCAMLDIDIVESPFIFYRFNKKMLVWDLCQNAVIWKCFARQSADGGQVGNVKGEAFEEYVYRRLCAIEMIEGLRRNTVIYSDAKKSLMDIDLGFVCMNTLFLVELKSFTRKKGEISGRFYKGFRLVKQLKKYDELLAKHQDKIFQEWGAFNIDKAIYILVTDDCQFIRLKDKSLWMIWGMIPRICILDEFMLYLRLLNSQEEG